MRFFRLTYFITVMVLLSGVSSIFAASVSIEKDTSGKDKLILENNLIRLKMDPQRGARVSNFRFKPWGDIEIIQDKIYHGLFVDHFWQEAWPGQFWEADYTYQIISKGPDEVSVKFSCISENKNIPQISGILLEKTVTLKENSRVLKVNIRLTNSSSEGKYVGYWFQNICWLGGDEEGDHYFRPTLRGVSKANFEEDPSPPNRGFVHEPQDGWTGAIDKRTETGLVFLMDYNYLWFLYNCPGANTVEWQYDAVAIPPGKIWQTEISLIPILKIDSLSFASENILGNVELEENKGKNQINIRETLLSSGSLIDSVEVKTGFETLLTHQIQTVSGPECLSNLGFEPKKVSLFLPYDTQEREPLAVRLTVEGKTTQDKNFEEHIELWYPGSFGENREPAAGAPFYKIPTPTKQKTFIKPEKIVRTHKEHPQVLFLKGFLSNNYKLETAIEKINPGSEINKGYAYIAVFGPELDYFPYDYDTLMSYDVLILGDISAANIGEAGMEMIKDYCKYGGNLLVVGGPFAYGNGGYKGTVMDEILPVLSYGPFDLRTSSDEMKLMPDQAIIRTNSVSTMKSEYIHNIKVKPEAKVLLSYGGYPFLVEGTYGSGKVICITGTSLGTDNFCDTMEWQDVLVNVFDYLGLGERRRQ